MYRFSAPTMSDVLRIDHSTQWNGENFGKRATIILRTKLNGENCGSSFMHNKRTYDTKHGRRIQIERYAIVYFFHEESMICKTGRCRRSRKTMVCVIAPYDLPWPMFFMSFNRFGSFDSVMSVYTLVMYYINLSDDVFLIEINGVFKQINWLNHSTWEWKSWLYTSWAIIYIYNLQNKQLFQ